MEQVNEKIKEDTENKKPYKFFIKLVERFYSDPKIKYIENRPNGKGIAYTYIKMMSLATSYSGALMLNDNLPFTDKDIAQEINEPLEMVKQTISLLLELGVMEIIKESDKEIYFLNEVPKMQQSQKDTPGNQRQIRFQEKKKEEQARKNIESIASETSKGITMYS